MVSRRRQVQEAIEAPRAEAKLEDVDDAGPPPLEEVSDTSDGEADTGNNVGDGVPNRSLQLASTDQPMMFCTVR